MLFEPRRAMMPPVISGNFFVSAAAGCLAFAGPAAGAKLLKPQPGLCKRQFQSFMQIPASAVEGAKNLLRGGKAPHQKESAPAAVHWAEEASRQAGESASAAVSFAPEAPRPAAGGAPIAAGMESYQAALRREAEALLSRSASRRELEALERARGMGDALDSAPPRRAKIKETAQSLKKAGFSKQEVRSLMESGMAPIRSMTGAEALAESLAKRGENTYFIDFEQNISRTLKITGEDDTGFQLETEILGPGGQKQIKTVSVRKDVFENLPVFPRALHPDAQILFESAESQRKKISRADLNLSPPSDIEAALKRQGLGPAWTRGMNKLNEWADLGRQLRELKPNPRKTHIQYFADQLHERIAFAGKSLAGMNLSRSKARQQKKALERIKREADRAILNEAASYEWWLELNWQLSALLADKHKRFLAGGDGFYRTQLQKIISLFPLQMALPAIEGQMGILTLSRAQSGGLHFIGLAGNAMPADGIIMDPLRFFSHDLTHAARNATAAAERFSRGHDLRHKKMQELMDGLAGQKRKRAELVYFAAVFENGDKNILLSGKSRGAVASYLSAFFYSALKSNVFSAKMAGLGEEFSGISEDGGMRHRAYIRDHIIEDFMREVYDPAF